MGKFSRVATKSKIWPQKWVGVSTCWEKLHESRVERRRSKLLDVLQSKRKLMSPVTKISCFNSMRLWSSLCIHWRRHCCWSHLHSKEENDTRYIMPITTFLFLTVAIQLKHSKLTVSDFPTVICLMFIAVFENNCKLNTFSFGPRMRNKFIIKGS